MNYIYLSRIVVTKLLLVLFLIPSLYAQDQNIGGDRTGEELIEYLRDNYTPNSTLGYNTARDRMYTILDNFDGVVICVYTYFEVPVDPNSSSPRADAYDNNNGINAEHLWPQSLGAGNEPARSDLHSLYPSEIRVNADRGNFKFGNIPDNQVSFWYNDDVKTSTAPPVDERDNWSKLRSGDRFEAKVDRKGDIARAMFYFYTIYTNVADDNFFDSMYEDLKLWHYEDEVDDYELGRTDQISEWQGNVNPFIMDTTLIRRAYFMESSGDPTDPGPDPEPVEGVTNFTETFGNPSSTTSIADHTYDNENLTFEGNGDIRSSIPSEGYEGASGNGLVFMNADYRFLTIGNIVTTGFESFNLSFGLHAFGTQQLTIEYSEDGDDWTEITYQQTQPSGSWTLMEINDFELPESESLKLRFSKDNGDQYRLDDITLSGLGGDDTEPEDNTPEVQASNISTSAITDSTAEISWTPGDGDFRLVVMQTDSDSFSDPVNETTYNASAEYGLGDEITDGQFVIYNGSGDQVTVQGLTETTEYHITIFEYNGQENEEHYLTEDNPVITFTTEAAPVSVLDDPNLPNTTTLAQNYPNPFNPVTTIAFELASDDLIRLTVFDMLGRELAVLINETKAAGSHQVSWDASKVGSGVYMYRLETSDAQFTRIMTLIK